jgi:pantoate--beta-alanine ligase
MVRDLDLPVQVVAVPTVRDDDGLALSSRNAYLSAADRRRALALVRSLRAGAAAADGGADVPTVLAAARELLEPVADRVDYVAVVDAEYVPVGPGWSGRGTLAVAALVAGTHLIDNLPISIGRPLGAVSSGRGGADTIGG